MQSDDVNDNRIQGLAQLLADQDSSKPAPVESWDPPYRGDIGLEIQADGRWFYQGSPIERQALIVLFSRVLRCDADGRHYLVTPAERVDVDVADAPFMAVEMQVDGVGRAQQLTFRTNVDDIVRGGANHGLYFKTDAATGGLKPYVTVRGRLVAVLTRALSYDLVALAMANAEQSDPKMAGRIGIWSDGIFFEMAKM